MIINDQQQYYMHKPIDYYNADFAFEDNQSKQFCREQNILKAA